MTLAAGIPAAFTRKDLETAGYIGWTSWRQLRSTHLAAVPRQPGCYVVYREAENPPTYLAANPGGRFKGKDPTVSRERLTAEWVPGANVVYIGKANDLFTRLKAYARFGDGDPVAHWGGRLIWQLADADELLVAWHALTVSTPARELEKLLLAHFAKQHDDQRPFANLTG